MSNKQSEVIDVLDIMMDSDDGFEGQNESMSTSDAFIECLNSKSMVDISYIAALAGKSEQSVADELKGVIYQAPENLQGLSEYDVTVGWEVAGNYLCGNVREKLKTARKMNRRFPHKFDSNIAALSNFAPADVSLDGIHLSLGASWIPEKEISAFIRDFLNIKNSFPKAVYSKDRKRWKITTVGGAHGSVLNSITYGVRGDDEGRWTKQYLTAIDIIEQTLNAKTVKVYDYIPTKSGWSGFNYEPVLNKEKTVEAQEKQKLIIDGFKDWVYSDAERIARFEEYYNKAFVGYVFTGYDGSFLKFPSLNPDITLYPHQKDAIARVLLSKTNVLLSHEVGTGKTFEIIVSAHELKRLHLSEKNLIVVPNNVLSAAIEMHKLLYKDDRILEVYPKDFTPERRNVTLDNIRYGNYVAIYMAYSSFNMIVMSKNYHIDKMTKEIERLKAAAFHAKQRYERKALEKQALSLSKKLTKYIAEEKECPWLTYDRLGIDTLYVDEAHNFKNIPINSRADNIVGMHNNGSKKCREMLDKAHTTPRVVFSTGTPLTNSLADLFTLMTYLQPQVLEYHNISTFDNWVNTFGQRETTVECDIDSNSDSLRTMTRFASFHNLSELMSLFSQVCDFHHMEKDEEGLPAFNGAINVCVPRNSAQRAYILSLSERTDLIRSKKVKRNEDNLLKVTIDGRKAALDIRLTDWDGPLDFSVKSKIDACAEKVYEMYLRHPDTAQVVFSDIGTPKSEFNVYDCLKDKLVRLGIPESEIAYVHDATTDSARSKLFTAVNKGKIRVIIGSTQKLGVGVNVQERLVALHHLSVPWKPSDMVQREGRILRKGNTCEEVFIFRYITEGTFDAYSWQLLQNKQKFISSFLSGTATERDADDIADAVLTYAEVKLLAIGNPLIKTRMETANRLERAKIACRSRQKQMQQLRAVIDMAPDKMRNLRKTVRIAKADLKDYLLNKESIPNDERIAFGEELLEALNANALSGEERVFGDYQCFSILLPANMRVEHPYLYITSEQGGKYYCEMKGDKTPLGCCRTIDYLLDHLSDYIKSLNSQISSVKRQVEEAQADLDNDNPHVDEIERIEEELKSIDKQIEENAKKDDKDD